MNKRTLTLFTSLALLMAVALIVLVLTSASAGQPPTIPPPQPHEFQGVANPNPYSAPGIAGIPPRSKGPIAYTTADVTQYIDANGFAGGPVVSGSHLVIEKILFITSKQASELTRGESVGRPDNAIVCYVQLRGPFIPGELDVPIGVSNPNATVLRVYEIFDAHTGNMLVWGGLP